MPKPPECIVRTKRPPAKPPPADPPRTPAEILIELGRELHGEHWIGPTARDLGIAHRTLTAFVSGKTAIREGRVLDDLRLLVDSHRKAVAQIRKIGRE